MLEEKIASQKDRVIVALDCDEKRAMEVAHLLAGQAKWLKVGMTLYYLSGPRIVSQLKDLGYQVFVDLKFHDIPHQVYGAAASVVSSGADMLTMHSIGGFDMLKAGVEGANLAAHELSVPTPYLLGITVLTSMDEAALESSGIQRSLDEQVLEMARCAQEAGLSGVVCSSHEIASIRMQWGQEACIVVPGVRPAGAQAGDQSRVATPEFAFSQGASYIVVGRPVVSSLDPQAAFANIISGLKE